VLHLKTIDGNGPLALASDSVSKSIASLTKRGPYKKKSAWRDYSADCKNGNNRNNHEQNDA